MLVIILSYELCAIKSSSFAAVNNLSRPLGKQVYFSGFKYDTLVGLMADRFLSILLVSLFQGLLVVIILNND